MNKSERLEDIGNRHSLALAERIFTEPGSENYKTLTECARLIRTEYMNFNDRRKRNRYGFRLCGTKYRNVILDKTEKY